MILKKITTYQQRGGSVHIGDSPSRIPRRTEWRLFGLPLFSITECAFEENDEKAYKTARYLFGIPVYTSIKRYGEHNLVFTSS